MKKNDLVKQVRKIVYEDCQKYLPYFWDYHLIPVLHYALMLAKMIKADQEIVEIATLLHDLTWLRGDKSNNHNFSAVKVAKEILETLNCPTEKITAIQHCILTHRGDEGDPKRETKEAECLASADVMAHLDSIPALLYYCYVTSDLTIEKSTKWLISKLDRGWRKMIPEARQIAKNKYDAAILILSANKNWFSK